MYCVWDQLNCILKGILIINVNQYTLNIVKRKMAFRHSSLNILKCCISLLYLNHLLEYCSIYIQRSNKWQFNYNMGINAEYYLWNDMAPICIKGQQVVRVKRSLWKLVGDKCLQHVYRKWHISMFLFIDIKKIRIITVVIIMFSAIYQFTLSENNLIN